ncbi:MAG: SufD family Fe-S cluster assembly protein, partial [Hyphomonadaceae bacterium]
EAWKWSDLRAAVDERTAAAARRSSAANVSAAAFGEGDVIAALAASFGAVESIQIAAGAPQLRVDRIAAEGFTAKAAAIALAPGADLLRIVIQVGGPGVALDTAAVRVAAGARYRQFVLAEGGKLARIETRIEAEGEGGAVRLDGLYLAGPGRHADLTSRVRHAAPGGATRQLVKGAARRGGRGVFQGRFEVARGAQQTDARQHHHGLLLEEGAEIYAKPELEIYADDVQCAHGNTAGALDDGALFYMRARGVGEREARALLTEAFLLEALPDDLPEDIHAEAEARVRAWLEAAG